ncbi:AtpZ/AtpI family protein [Lacibacter sp. MH-610]|jgi:F0F1-type ATP synthase assembly protein I|uniref:AtpZ/AtpI family protein n=1 Tax=Lacibacter sp. MH-610 TaxID=3020883 RepID=UPI00389271C3
MEPSSHNKKPFRSNKSYLMEYAGLASQLMAALGLGVFIGYKLDGWLSISFPVFIWVLPLVFLMAMFVKIFKDTSRKK